MAKIDASQNLPTPAKAVKMMELKMRIMSISAIKCVDLVSESSKLVSKDTEVDALGHAAQVESHGCK